MAEEVEKSIIADTVVGTAGYQRDRTDTVFRSSPKKAVTGPDVAGVNDEAIEEAIAEWLSKDVASWVIPNEQPVSFTPKSPTLSRYGEAPLMDEHEVQDLVHKYNMSLKKADEELDKKARLLQEKQASFIIAEANYVLAFREPYDKMMAMDYRQREDKRRHQVIAHKAVEAHEEVEHLQDEVAKLEDKKGFWKRNRDSLMGTLSQYALKQIEIEEAIEEHAYAEDDSYWGEAVISHSQDLEGGTADKARIVVIENSVYRGTLVPFQSDYVGGIDGYKAVAAKRICDYLPFESDDIFVPPAVVKYVEGRKMVLQQQVRFGDMTDEWENTSMDCLRDAALFDLVIGNMNRHSGNAVAIGDTLYLIDNYRSFPLMGEEDEAYSCIIDGIGETSLSDFHRDCMTKLLSNFDVLSAELVELLNEGQIIAIRGRIERLVRHNKYRVVGNYL